MAFPVIIVRPLLKLRVPFTFASLKVIVVAFKVLTFASFVVKLPLTETLPFNLLSPFTCKLPPTVKLPLIVPERAAMLPVVIILPLFLINNDVPVTLPALISPSVVKPDILN